MVGLELLPLHAVCMLRISLYCVVEVLENMVFLSNASNFVAYFLQSMHYSAAKSANMVTNFMGTSFLLTIVGGFICDSFITKFTTFISSCVVELLGLILLTIQADHPHLRPAMNSSPSKSQEAILYTGVYVMATGVAGIKASLPTHGADQLDCSNPRLITSFFNWFFFSLCTGGLISATVMMWVEENKGWNWSFKISIVALVLALCIFTMGTPIYRNKRPSGSPLTRIFQILASAIKNRNASLPERLTEQTPSQLNPKRYEKYHYRFLDKALINTAIDSDEVEETRTFLALLPIFASTIMMNCCLAQLQTFSVQQGNIMNRKIHHFQIPTQSLSVLPISIMLASVALFDRLLRTLGNMSKTFRPLRRIGVGLALASASMATAAVVESKRRWAAENNVTLSVFWLAWQYLLLGISDMLTLGGMFEFFYSEAPHSMRSMSTALSWCSTSVGYFLSSVLVAITNSVTGKFGHEWLGGNNLNKSRLDLFYMLLCILNFLNILNYMYWAKRY
ncbi:protein NRT1/ PTR FAMILY 4.2 isoform X2 [Ziziphus jujuba]|uniref:Protein NRT1/ PTR FAMILY 4.2-like isoform X2 n=1 Tax=Ziziphus jujuba TaxID=326968 RepID=A0A6P6GGM4_ZIZJJ|nr:protein NRT1/ PTR FAMILY 4.2-like isoform X2 [Ziziphus jujuba var. spinosa]XP_024932884.1 protein NRT1/ PTR FAMILY 4.2 isoform X2 [Ziziphus jujuba]XP_024932885.1 protein NRT1/ PTR FAMILY 4.2 isoform X2 [Ziziphus jujuba]